MEFRGIVLENQPDFSASVQSISRARLDEHAAAGNVLVHIAYSTINYKDGLALTNKSPVVRKWPMVPGIDGAGVVEESDDPMFPVGSSVILNGFGVGETHWGCLAAYALLKAEWLIPMPAQMDARTAMIIGTAGYTAMLCLQALEQQGLRPEHGEVLVTGAAGGVGSVAVVAPFILRNVRLLGVDSVMASRALREKAWDALSHTLNREHLSAMCTEIGLDDCIAAGASILAGEIRGRLLVNLRH
ncbi:MAG: hypothetical protein EB133_06315 [Betaproteobacteria bacterium]|nr:hypothetical protein [Betaproteobacteria bacterium]